MNKNPHKRLFSHYPLFQLSLAYAAGVMTANFVSIRHLVILVLCAVSSLLVAPLLAKGRLQLAGVCLLTSLFFAGYSLSLIENRPTPANALRQLLENGCVDDQQPAFLTGVLDQSPELTSDRVYLVLRLEGIETETFAGQVNGSVALAALFKTAIDRQEYQHLQLHYGARFAQR